MIHKCFLLKLGRLHLKLSRLYRWFYFIFTFRVGTLKLNRICIKITCTWVFLPLSQELWGVSHLGKEWPSLGTFTWGQGIRNHSWTLVVVTGDSSFEKKKLGRRLLLFFSFQRKAKNKLLSLKNHLTWQWVTALVIFHELGWKSLYGRSN